MPHNLIFASVYFVLSKSYAISFMATWVHQYLKITLISWMQRTISFANRMNTRRCIRGRGTDTDNNGSTAYSTSRSTNLQLNSRVPDPNGGSMGFWRSEVRFCCIGQEHKLNQNSHYLTGSQTELSYKNPTQVSVHPESSREFVQLQYLPTTKEVGILI
jgi:hypothetical protein